PVAQQARVSGRARKARLKYTVKRAGEGSPAGVFRAFGSTGSGGGCVVPATLEQAGDGGDSQDRENDDQRQPGGNGWNQVDGIAAVDEGQAVGVHGLDDQLDADESQHHGQAEAQVDQSFEKAADEEVEFDQAKQGEGVGGEHDI